jgi:hypothetical protein
MCHDVYVSFTRTALFFVVGWLIGSSVIGTVVWWVGGCLAASRLVQFICINVHYSIYRNTFYFFIMPNVSVNISHHQAVFANP